MKKGYKKVGLLSTRGTQKTHLYDKVLTKRDIKFLKPGIYESEELMRNIYEFKKNGNINITFLRDVLINFDELGVDAVILGCTELAMMYSNIKYSMKFVDSTLELAKKQLNLYDENLN